MVWARCRGSDTPVLPKIANAWDMLNTVRSRPQSVLRVIKPQKTMPVMERVRLFKVAREHVVPRHGRCRKMDFLRLNNPRLDVLAIYARLD
jgi:hypothetical protein